MPPTVASLALTPSWQGEQVLLVRATDAIRLCREGGFEEVPRHRLGAFLSNLGHREAERIRTFVWRARLASTPLNDLGDDALLALLRSLVQRQDLAILRTCELGSGGQEKELVAQRKLVREIEAMTRGRLTTAGRQYRLVAGDDLGKLPDRNSYEVVRKADAVRVLVAVAEQHGSGTVGLPELLERAREKLTRNWRPPFQPDGLVLLRKIVVVQSQRQDEAPALTPSALRALRDEGWIEIVFVDAGMEPVPDVDFDVRLVEGQMRSGKTNKNGSARFEGITPGECQVSFPKVMGPVVLV